MHEAETAAGGVPDAEPRSKQVGPTLASPGRFGLAGAVARYRADHLIRASAFNITSTVASSGFGFIYWLIAARVTSTEAVGYASAAIALTTATSLVTSLGVSSLMIARLPGLERTSGWSSLLTSWLWPTALLSGLVAGVVGLIIRTGSDHHSGRGPILLIVSVAAAALTVLAILDRVFLSARRTELGTVLATALGVAKVASLSALLLSGADVVLMLFGWLCALLLCCAFAILALVPRTGLGRVGRPSRLRVTRPDLSAAFGHHLTSVGGLMTPYLLPPLVVYRLGATENAYFYAAWMLGSAFLIVSPSVAASLFGEGSRDASVLASRTRAAVRLVAILLPVPIVVGVLVGYWVLYLFGPAYAREGYLLLVVLAVSSIPDAFANIAVAVLRVQGHLRSSSALNLAMGLVALGGAWVLLPVYGVVGAGIAWLGSQVIGCIAVAPMMTDILRRGRAVRG